MRTPDRARGPFGSMYSTQICQANLPDCLKYILLDFSMASEAPPGVGAASRYERAISRRRISWRARLGRAKVSLNVERLHIRGKNRKPRSGQRNLTPTMYLIETINITYPL